MFERFTDRSRRVLVLAQEEARLLNHSFIGTEHLLLGLISEREGVAAQALAELDISLEAVRAKVEETIGLSGTEPVGLAPFTPRAKKVLELALREALQFGHNYIGTEHILLGLVREGEGVAAHVLVSLGADLGRVRLQVVQVLSGYSPPKETFAGRAEGTMVRCSFCALAPPESGRLIAGQNDTYICEHCVRRWSTDLGADEPGPEDAPPGDEPPRPGPEGSPRHN